MRVYIIRHADPDYPNNTITPAGHLEAQALAKRMAAEKLDRIYSSPLGRAIDTMRYTADATGLSPSTEEWTRELGDCTVEPPPWGRMSMFNLPGEIIRGQETLPGHEDWHTIPHLGEPKFRTQMEALRAFSDEFFLRHGYEREGWRYRCVSPNRERIAVFCHAGFGMSWIAHLLALPVPLVWSGFFLPPSSVTTMLMEERSDEWATPRCMGLGDVGHLYAAGLPVQPSGVVARNW